MLELKNISLVTIATRNHLEGRAAINSCLDAANFGNVIVLTDAPDNYKEYICLKVTPRSREEWCVYRLTEFPKLRDKFLNYILFIESDSRLVNPAAWNNQFYDFDYIGAPWKDRVVGNGGFTLMSQKFLATIDRLRFPSSVKVCHACDWKVCRHYKIKFESYGCKYAPYSIANKFSNEFKEYYGAFGVHSNYMLDVVRKKGILKDKPATV